MSIKARLDTDRKELLDLSLRNTLLNFRLLKSRGVQVVDELSAEAYRILVGEGRRMSFLPAPEDHDRASVALLNGTVSSLFEFEQPEEEEEEAPGGRVASRHRDSKLQTSHVSSKLQKRLLSSYQAARTAIEEHGVNTLYLSLGMLQWYEADQSEQTRMAPLLLIPVDLERTDVRSRFHVSHSGGELRTNLSLQHKLKHDFGIDLPEVDLSEDLDVADYFSRVESSVRSQPRWKVERDEIQLGFFSFTKLLMFEDLAPENWTNEIGEVDHPVLGQLLDFGFRDPGPGTQADLGLDDALDSNSVCPIWDADSSQTLAIADVIAGRNLIIQGPPGTGKSQTITNLIAEAIVKDKKVLFVAEKLAALEVVKRRLDNASVGEACLELHSHKANKRAVLEDLQSTWLLGEPLAGPARGNGRALKDARDRLNRYCAELHAPIGRSDVTPFAAFSELVRLARELQGIDVPGVPLPSASEWTRSDFERRVAAVEELQALIRDIGRPVDHPFWGSRLRVALPSLRETIHEKVGVAGRALTDLASTAKAAADELGMPAPNSLDEAERLLETGQRALEAPPLGNVAVADTRWIERRNDIEESIDLGQKVRELREARAGEVLNSAWGEDVSNTRKTLAEYGPRWWRFAVRDYRLANRRFQGLLSGRPPRALNQRLDVLDAILKAQELMAQLKEHVDVVKALLGPLWKSHESDWVKIHEVTKYLTRLHDDVAEGSVAREVIKFVANNPENREALKSGLEKLKARRDSFIQEARSLLEALVADEKIMLPRGVDSTPFASWSSLLIGWRDSVPRVAEVVRLNELATRLSHEGLESVFHVSRDWSHAGRHLASLLKRKWFELLVESALSERRALATFHGPTHEETIRKFRELDAAVFETNRSVVATAHWRGLPERASVGQTAVLLREFEKRRRHLPVRRLIEQAGQAIQAIKPVFMMSPLSIAAYLQPNTVHFDLVIFDEASQVTPVDAYGAILRGQQSAVVGDSKQLPPTPFFMTLSEGVEDDLEEQSTSDLESILGQFQAQGAPSRMLRWHYRSRHESLIAVSNYQFYDNKLIVLPSPQADRSELGLVFRYLPESAYQRGRGLSCNPKEAERVVRGVMNHARTRPDLTLGVAAFSRSQQETILDYLEKARREDPSCEVFFASHPEEPFFVKNLENVQGDERDVILVSVGYGRTEEGYFAMNFGPLNQQGGERRLNVLITRARYRCEVFTNLKAEDLDLRRSSAQGVVALKAFLKYAETGILDVPQSSARGAESLFEFEVADRLKAAGCDVELQVGTGGFFVDIGIRDPEQPGRFLLGVECDGASYHSAAWARDRDRLRQQVLESLGWRIHRVWSTDWFQDPDRELDRLLQVVREQLSVPVELRTRPRTPGTGAWATGSTDGVVREANGDTRVVELEGDPYDMCVPEVTLRGTELHQVRPQIVAQWVKEVVDVESPVHFSEVCQRIISAAGIQRLGSRIEENMGRGVRQAEATGLVVRRGDFLWSPGGTKPKVRDRSALPMSSRKIEFICDEELGDAIQRILAAAVGADEAAVVQRTCRMVGFARTTEGMRTRVEQVIASLVSRGILTRNSNSLSIAF